GRGVAAAGEHLLELELGHGIGHLDSWGAGRNGRHPCRRRRVASSYFLRNWSSLTTFDAASSALASAGLAASDAIGVSGLASDVAGPASGGRFSGAGNGVGGWAASTFSGALSFSLSLRSNCRPKRTDGSTKADSAANGTLMRSCCLLKLTVTSNDSGLM